jgi:phosphoglycolate phosphatase
MNSCSLPRAWDEFDTYLFDIDGTLLNCSDATHYLAFCNALESVAGRPLTLDGVVTHGNTDVGILRDALRLAGVPDDLWRAQIAQIREQMCSFVEQRETNVCTEVLPSVQRVLTYLHSKNTVLGVATGNLKTIGQLKLRRAGLLSFFQFAAWSDEFENRCNVFAAASRAAREATRPDAMICVVGDTPADIHAARENEMSVIAVATGIHPFETLAANKPDLCIRTFDELLDTAVPARA